VRQIRWTTEASDQLVATVKHIQQDDPTAGTAWNVRELVNPPYIVVYRYTGEIVEMLHIWHMVRRIGVDYHACTLLPRPILKFCFSRGSLSSEINPPIVWLTLILPAFRGIRQLCQDPLDALYDNLLLLELIEGRLLAKFGRQKNRASKRELADGFPLQQWAGG
jgi:hypothetical protein